MPNIFHQSVEDILKAATPEQKIAWNDIFLRYGDRISISQLLIKGVAGELLVYTARKMYFGLMLTATPAIAAFGSGGFNRITLYDEANAIQNELANVAPYWDATAAAFRNIPNTINAENVLFSRIVLSGYGNVIFIGYRIVY